MTYLITMLLVALGFGLYSLTRRVDRLQHWLDLRSESQASIPAARELVIELRYSAIMSHPDYAPYYASVIEKRAQSRGSIAQSVHPLLDRSSFRLLHFRDDVIWSDEHKTFTPEFKIRSRILENDASVFDEEPWLLLRVHNGTLQLSLEGPLKAEKKIVRLSEFPLFVFTPPAGPMFPMDLIDPQKAEIARQLGKLRAQGDGVKYVELLVQEVAKSGFKWLNLGELDVNENALGGLELYDPNHGYLSFADPYVRVRYKEWAWQWIGSGTKDEYRPILARLGVEERRLFD